MKHQLTQRQAEIVLNRFKNQEPLNISFMFRNYPDIMDRVFPEESPVGWRRTLIALGIDPYSIEHELEQYVDCSICGESFECLLHHIKCHEISADEYRQQFGQDVLFYSEVYRYRATDSQPILDVEHWELIWTPHYVIDFILAIDEIPGGIRQLDISYGGTLYNKGISYFGNWNNALQRAGVDKSKPGSVLSVSETMNRITAFLSDKKETPYLKTPAEITAALEHHFDSTRAAAEELQFDHDEVFDRQEAVIALAEEAASELMTLAGKRGIIRRKALLEIWEKYGHHLRGYYNHTKSLAIDMGVPLHYIDKRTYRDVTDIHHDLDLLEAAGIKLTGPNLHEFNLHLYRTVMENPEARSRLTKSRSAF